MALTLKQVRFIAEYVVDGNASRAARQAGYSTRTARQIASENLTKPDILAAIAQKKHAEAEKLELTKQDILASLMGAIDLAREVGKPSVMVSGYRELGRLCGFYEAETLQRKDPLTTEADILRRELESLPTSQLLEMVAKKRAMTTLL